MKKVILRILGIFAFVIGGYLLTPKVESGAITMEYPVLPADLTELEFYVNKKEASVNGIREDNEARIIWNDSTKSKTEYCIVYLHGYSASWYEGEPVHRETAKRYGMNLYLSRLEGHGIGSKESFKNLTADAYLDSALEAIAIGKQLGEKVIIMGCSTGGTVGLPAMAFDSEISAGIFYSPNIDVVDQNSNLLRRPFGLELARMVTGSDYHRFDGPPSIYKYWTNEYRIEGLVTLRELLDKTMTEETFSKIKQPSLILAYYENEEHQDPVVSVAAIDEMYQNLGTEKSKKVYKKIASVRDHVMACESHSKDLEIVRAETYSFIENVLGISPVE